MWAHCCMSNFEFSSSRCSISNCIRRKTRKPVSSWEGSSGEEALDLSERWMPDLVLMDIRMPGMGGLEATKRLKEKYP